MRCPTGFKLPVKSKLGHWAPGDVLRDEFVVIPSIFLFHKLSRSEKCFYSSVIQLIVHNDNLPNNNSSSNYIGDIVFSSCDSVFNAGISVSSIEWNLQQSGLLSDAICGK